MKALAFDVYGTLIDTSGVTTRLHGMVGDQATAFSTLWRTKQLEYTWRYGLMGVYRNFRICTKQALDFSCEQLGCDLSEADKKALMQKYLELPVFDDVLDGLERLKSADVAMYAFSNGVPDDLTKLLTHAQIIDFMDGIVSVDVNKTFKPNPLVYQQFVEVAGTVPQESWLVSSNGFDVCGAVAAGMRAVWLQRSTAVCFDHWEFEPDKVVSTFGEMTDIFV